MTDNPHPAQEPEIVATKLSHKKQKALFRKQKRKLKRQSEAQQRQHDEEEEDKLKENSPSFQAKLKEREEAEKLLEQRDEAERAYLEKLWVEKERIAQEEWKNKKLREERERQKKAEIEKKIREEWEERQRKEKEETEKTEKKKEKQEELLRQATANENKDGPWHNPIATILPGKERETCMFFAKTGTCRFGDRCSRGHPQPDNSNTLLFPGMYNHFELQQGLKDEYDTDIVLEYEEGELYNNFKEFYEDIIPEFKAIGEVIQVKVCCNYEPHLRGNVYIQYRREEEAQLAFMNFNGRYYGGRQLSCDFVDIKKWKSAICGLFGSGRCPKGRNCNFLHVFKNPRNEFFDADRDFSNQSVAGSSRYSHRNRAYHRDRSERYRSRSPDDRRSHRSRRRSWSRERKRKSRSRSYERSSRRYSRSRSRDKSSRSRKYKKRSRHSRSRSNSQPGHRKHSRSTSKEKQLSPSWRSRSRSSSNPRLSVSPSQSKRSGKSYDIDQFTKANEQDVTSDSVSHSLSGLKSNEKGKLSNRNTRDYNMDPDYEDYTNVSKNGYYSDSDSKTKSHKKQKKHKKHKHKKVHD